MFVYVRQEDIDRGIPDDVYMCPLALAINRRTGTNEAMVGELTYRVRLHESPRHLSKSGQRFVDRFDTGQKVYLGLYWI